MAALLDRADQAISVTQVSRAARDIFNKLAKGKQDRFVVLRNNQPAAVMLSVDFFQSLMNELEDLRIEAIARSRLRTLKSAKTITHRAMMKRFGLKLRG